MRKMEITVCVLLLILLVACAKEQVAAPISEPSASSDTNGAVDNSNVVLEMSVQEYTDNDIVEIPYFRYDETNPTLAQFDGKNPELDGINRMLRFGLISQYEEFLEKRTEDEAIEIRSYPFTDDAMIQVVITQIYHPAYGTDGDLQSINFSRKQNKMLLLDEVMAELGLTQEQLSKDIIAKYKDEEEAQRIATSAKATGFLLQDNKIVLLLEVETNSPASVDWKQFHSYEPQSGELIHLPSGSLFDRKSLDQLSPPLTYDRVEIER